MYRLILLFTVLLITVSDSEAQLFKKVLDRTADKLANRVEDRIVEEVSNELVNMAVRPLDNYMDQLFRQRYNCLLYTSPSPRDLSTSRMPSSA